MAFTSEILHYQLKHIRIHCLDHLYHESLRIHQEYSLEQKLIGNISTPYTVLFVATWRCSLLRMMISLPHLLDGKLALAWVKLASVAFIAPSSHPKLELSEPYVTHHQSLPFTTLSRT
jgi:hypothetical protein